jgi:hypothetical protein
VKTKISEFSGSKLLTSSFVTFWFVTLIPRQSKFATFSKGSVVKQSVDTILPKFQISQYNCPLHMTLQWFVTTNNADKKIAISLPKTKSALWFVKPKDVEQTRSYRMEVRMFPASVLSIYTFFKHIYEIGYLCKGKIHFIAKCMAGTEKRTWWVYSHQWRTYRTPRSGKIHLTSHFLPDSFTINFQNYLNNFRARPL